MYTSLGTDSSLWDTYISVSTVKKKKKRDVLRCTFLVAVFVALFVAYADKHGFPWCSVSFYICINLYIIYTYIYKPVYNVIKWNSKLLIVICR